ncbi:transient receptor potential cation channel subfamily V member 6-like [Pollicipes pollicipes]|uniref:transient receptor potential cation channel subfamily V member 6-like n=1 Tax=Pollicipes pollicipes TaxID=41117 RepID=UPI001885694A|nr:transient receptor potential cation channel subfamily V member 6-like [Pollicipes pollicipes]
MGQLQSRGSVWKDPGAALDRVISQSHEEGQCLLYKLANYKKGGELLDAYRIGGGREVEKLILDQFSVFMYNEGRGKEITRTEYLKWKLRGKTRDECALNMEPGEKSRFDPLNFWQDHEACWQMQYRGNLGETLLHMLIICNTRAHSRIAKILLKCFPKLAVDVVEGPEYLGASALHLAIAYNNNEVATQLIEANAKVDQRAIGSFFLPRDQQREVPRTQTDYEGLAYMGETLLNWAACCNNETCYNLLLDRDADPNAQDSFGNMVLHMIVVCDKQEMFGYALRHPKRPAKNGVLNRVGLTPLTLACRLARSEIFREMLELTCIEFWRYSNITCSAYPLNALDTIGPDGKTNWNSALMMILNGKKDEHLDMLEGGIIQRLLEEKWQCFARAEFLRKLMIMMMHLLSISLAMYLRPEYGQTLTGTTSKDIARYCFEATTLLGCMYYLVLQSGSEIKNQGLVPFIIQLFHDPIQLAFNISNLALVGCVPLRVFELRAVEELVLTVAVPGSWFHLMFFAGAIQLTGPFVTMVFKIITNDMVTFFIIYSIFLLAFTQAFFFLYRGTPNRATSKFTTYIDTWMGLFHMTLGDYDFGELSRSAYAPLTLITFVLFMVLVPILLLNMLIAMMGNTYATVVQQSEKEWVKQWANIVITLERGVGSDKCKSNLEAYSLPLPGGDDRRGVVVIKSKSKTRARQRKGALTNWKRVGRVTLKALKRRRITGDALRKEMWGLESVHTTPIKSSKRKIRAPHADFI